MPWRYRWPDDFRDEVLARLLELNAERHKEELLAAKADDQPTKKIQPKRKRAKKKQPDERELF